MIRWSRSTFGRMLSSQAVPRASGGPDWNRMLASATSEEEKAAISAVRSSLMKLQTLVVEAEKPAVPIDWKYFEEAISDNSIVKDFKTAYEKLSFKKESENLKKIPDSIKSDHQTASKEVKEIVGQISKYIKSLEQQLTEMESAKIDLKSESVDSFLKKNPDLDKKYTEEIKNENWF